MECTLLREELLETLYGEAGPETVARVEAHLGLCASCSRELAALRALRRDLQRWEAPAAARTTLPRRRALVPALAAAAALVAVLAGGMLLGGAELRYEDGRFAFRVGRGAAELERRLAEQELRHRREIEALRASLAARGPDEGALLSRVQQLVRESEARQAVLLNASLAGLEARADAQRRYDLARVSAGLSYLDGKTGEQVARTTELVGYALQASQKR